MFKARLYLALKERFSGHQKLGYTYSWEGRILDSYGWEGRKGVLTVRSQATVEGNVLLAPGTPT